MPSLQVDGRTHDLPSHFDRVDSEQDPSQGIHTQIIILNVLSASEGEDADIREVDRSVCFQAGVHGFHLVVCDEAEIYVEMLYGCALGGGKSKKAVGLVEEGGPVGKGADFGIGGGWRRHIVLEGSTIPFSPFYTPTADPPMMQERAPLASSFLVFQARAPRREESLVQNYLVT